jgi:outer membrane protein assembly factor BamB
MATLGNPLDRLYSPILLLEIFMRYAILLCLFPCLFGADWSQWRGPNRNATTDVQVPSTWPDRLKKGWSITVGEGHSSPVVVGDRVYQHTRLDDQEVVYCLNWKDGKEIWKVTNKAPYEMHSAATGHGKGPKSTPTVVDGRVYTFGISGILSCLDAKKGEVLWRKEFGKQFKTTSPLYGTAMSPLVIDGLCIAHVGGHDQGNLAAFDAKTGEEKWSATKDGPGYSSPILATLANKKQLVTQTQNHLVGINPKNGQLLWKVPFTTGYDQNAITAVTHKNLVVFSGYEKPLQALKVLNTVDGFDTEEVWANRNFPLYMSSPVLVGDRLFGLSQKKRGVLFCVDCNTGKVIWENEGRSGDNASLVAVGKVILVLNTDGKLLVLNAARNQFDVIKEYTVSDTPTWAHLAIFEGGILVKDLKTLTRWDWK